MATSQLVKMDPEVKAEWVQALRSGDYLQGRGYLRRVLENSPTLDEGYCCLGVVCDLYHKNNGKGHWGDSNRFGSRFFTEGDHSNTDLPNEVQNWSGLTDDEIRGELARKNDNGLFDFNAIADWIDENL